MPDGLYDRDILVWSEQQADLLRRMAAGERLNGQVDWANVIEELEDVGRSELHSCESLLERAMSHLLKLHAEPDSPAAKHWRGEVVTFLASANRRFAPSMRSRIDLHALYAVARRAAEAGPSATPYTLDDLLTDAPDIHALLARLDGTA